MSDRRIAARAAMRVGLREKQPTRNRTGRFAVLILGAGALSGIAAMLGVWPFGGLQVLVTHVIRGDATAAPIEARTLFPPVPPVHQVIDVYDPPPPAAPAPPAAKPAPQPPQATPTPRHEHPSPTPTMHSSPSPSPKGDD